jgi:hypothetical protein
MWVVCDVRKYLMEGVRSKQQCTSRRSAGGACSVEDTCMPARIGEAAAARTKCANRTPYLRNELLAEIRHLQCDQLPSDDTKAVYVTLSNEQ